MKVLWFEITKPSNYDNQNSFLGGWQDSLESLLKTRDDIELHVSFVSKNETEVKSVDGVTYWPLCYKYSAFSKIKRLFTWDAERELCINECKRVVDAINPDIIHVFGTEYPFALITQYTTIPVVVHIQGCIVAYHNASYPPGYNRSTFVKQSFPNIVKQIYTYIKDHKELTRVQMEYDIWKSVRHYMGRTIWDRALTTTLSGSANYYCVNEAIRPLFHQTNKVWAYQKRNKLKFVTIGIGTFWKGPELILKTAHILKTNGIDFEWYVAGAIRGDVKKVVEKQENLKYEDNNIKILGFQTPSELIELLTDCSLYIHCAYIDNSPNSICEAQLLGVPILSTNVGGIESLVENNKTGILVPANDPWRMAYEIIDLSQDQGRLEKLSINASLCARDRHSASRIVEELMNCYNSIIANK